MASSNGRVTITKIAILDHRKGNIVNDNEIEAISHASYVFTIHPDDHVEVKCLDNAYNYEGIEAVFVEGLTEPEFSLQQAEMHKKLREKPVEPMTDNERTDALAKATGVWAEAE